MCSVVVLAPAIRSKQERLFCCGVYKCKSEKTETAEKENSPWATADRWLKPTKYILMYLFRQIHRCGGFWWGRDYRVKGVLWILSNKFLFIRPVQLSSWCHSQSYRDPTNKELGICSETSNTTNKHHTRAQTKHQDCPKLGYISQRTKQKTLW